VSMTESARGRRLEARRQEILGAARERAEEGGWASVTTRALADAIGYSQPVLYSHFPAGKSEIMSAVALDGFGELATVTRAAAEGRRGIDALIATAEAYLHFAAANSAVYEAMFTLPISATFGRADSEPELREAFAVLASVVDDATDDTETAAEVFWSALHGLSGLERAGRLRPEFHSARLHTMAAYIVASPNG